MKRAGTSPGCRGLAALVIAVAPAVLAPRPVAAASALKELEAGVRLVLSESKTPGAGVALVSREEMLWAAGFGLADRESGRAVTPDTLFRTGSISKSFVSVAVLQLVERGLVRLEDRVRDLAPEVAFENPWEESEPVRLVHLLEHTAGFDDIHPREYAHNEIEPISLRQALAFDPKSRVSRWPPGTHFSYCNSGPSIAAYVVEKLTGRRFEDYVRVEILEPLGMHTASYFLTPEVERALAQGYERDGVTETFYWHISLRPSGALNASTREMARFVRMLAGRGSLDGSRLLEPTSIERMERPASSQLARAGVRAGYALGNYTSQYEGFLFQGHGGGVNGGISEYGYLADHGVGYVLLLNAVDGDAFRRIRDLLRDYLIRDLEPPAASTAAPAPEALAALAGWYEPLVVRNEIARFLFRIVGKVRVEAQDDRLRVGPLVGEAVEWLPVDRRRFRRAGHPEADLVFLDEGGSRMEGASGPAAGGFVRRSAARVWLEWIVAAASVALMLSSVLFALAWVPRKLFGRLADAGPLSVRTMPLAAVLSLAAALLAVALGAGDMVWNFGRPTIWSVSFALLTWLFAALTVASLAWVWRARGRTGRRAVWLHSLLVSVACLVVLVYLAWWGIIGFRTWA